MPTRDGRQAAYTDAGAVWKGANGSSAVGRR